MTIYVDEIRNWGKRGAWSHMMCDGDIEELHKFALRIGLKRNWFQYDPRHPHYDLRPSKRALAVQYGAEEVSSTEMLLVCTFPQDLAMLSAAHDACDDDDEQRARILLKAIRRGEVKMTPWETVKAGLVERGMIDADDPAQGEEDRVTG